MGYNIGMRLIEDFLAKSNILECKNFRETADVIAKIGFKIFLNVTPSVTGWTSDGKGFSLVFEENPLADFVELPDDGRAQDELWYSNILCGVLRGALEMVRTATGVMGVEIYADFDYRSQCRSSAISSAMC
jgi:trafficking protein particle complex subunit 3